MRVKDTRRRRAQKAPDNLVYFPGCRPESGPPTIQPICLHRSVGNIGYVSGEVVYAVLVERLKLDDAAALDTPAGLCLGRVVRVGHRGLTIRLEDGSDCYHDWAELDWAGRIIGATLGPADERFAEIIM